MEAAAWSRLDVNSASLRPELGEVPAFEPRAGPRSVAVPVALVALVAVLAFEDGALGAGSVDLPLPALLCERRVSALTLQFGVAAEVPRDRIRPDGWGVSRFRALPGRR